MLVKQFGAPLPGTPAQLAAGALVGAGQLNFALVLVAPAFGDAFWYWFGRIKGVHLLKTFCRVALEPDHCVRTTQKPLPNAAPACCFMPNSFPAWARSLSRSPV